MVPCCDRVGVLEVSIAYQRAWAWESPAMPTVWAATSELLRHSALRIRLSLVVIREVLPF